MLTFPCIKIMQIDDFPDWRGQVLEWTEHRPSSDLDSGSDTDVSDLSMSEEDPSEGPSTSSSDESSSSGKKTPPKNELLWYKKKA